jgi:membrane associated rhomboid family serine protease
MDLISEIKSSFSKGSTLTKLIYINLGIYLLVLLFRIISFLFRLDPGIFNLTDFLSVHSSPRLFLLRPWTVITYMFLHTAFWHILFNLLWLYWFGTIFLRFLTEKQLLSTYLLGGITGALVFVLSFNLFPVFQDSVEFSSALGASASVMAIIVAITVYTPNYQVYLILIGPVKIKYITLVFILLDLVQLPLENSGGHLAHLGGAVWGYLFIANLKKGKDITRRFDRIADSLFTRFQSKKKMRVTYRNTNPDIEYNAAKREEQATIDLILEKISKSGYDSLSREEKDLLFNFSQKRKK